MTRKFNLINPAKKELKPVRSTKLSAGYDLRSRATIEVPPMVNAMKSYLASIDLETYGSGQLSSNEIKKIIQQFNVTMVPTGVSVKMKAGECLILASRSSNATKRHLLIPNGIGVVDADYHDEIMVPFLNFGRDPYEISAGDRIAQGIFMPFLLTDDDIAGTERTGGFGSTGKN